VGIRGRKYQEAGGRLNNLKLQKLLLGSSNEGKRGGYCMCHVWENRTTFCSIN
jgi:hypothetical protein